MKALFQQLEVRKKELQHAIEQAEQILREAPPGRLRISSSNGSRQYCYVPEETDSKRSGKPAAEYIRKENINLAVQLANRDYAYQFLVSARKELQDIEAYLKKYSIRNPESVYSNLLEARKSLVNPILSPDEEYIQHWIQTPFSGNPFHADELIYETKRGELVRSKSEAIIADIYHDLGIPYRYEAPFKQKDGTIKYPDFTALKLSTRELIYHEHLGLLDDSGYRRENLRKIITYSENGIFLGKNLIFTYEAEGCPLNTRAIRKMILAVIKG